MKRLLLPLLAALALPTPVNAKPIWSLIAGNRGCPMRSLDSPKDCSLFIDMRSIFYRGDLVYFTWLNDDPELVLGGNYNKSRTWEMEFNCKNKTLKLLDTLNGGFTWESWDSKKNNDDSWILAGNFVCKR